MRRWPWHAATTALVAGCAAFGLSACVGTTGSAAAPASARTGLTPARCAVSRLVVPGSAPILPAPGRAGTAHTLVPTGPSSMTVCRYAGFNQTVKAGTLVRSHVVTGSALRAFVAWADDPEWQVISRPSEYLCPVDDASIDLMRFAYASGRGVTVTVDLGGCRFASNGVRTVSGYSIASRLAAWVGPTKAP